MTAQSLSMEHLALLATFDTPTVCNAIEVAQGQRGFSGFTHSTMHWSDVETFNMVGYARTAKISSLQPSKEDSAVVRERRRDYFRHMAEGPRPGVCVIEDIDGDSAIGAWWGEIHAQIHKSVCGLAGAVTNGLMRDLADLPSGFPILAGGLGPSHGFVHVKEIGMPVSILGATVNEGDLVHADQHGMVVIPKEVEHDLPAAIARLISSESIVLDAVKQRSVSIEEFEELWAQFEKART